MVTPARPDRPLPFVICLAGPTGSGKTRLGLELAKTLACEIINADSRQVYADFPIITAQPDPTALDVCPHHLYGFLETSHKIDAGQWLTLLLPLIKDISIRGKIPLLIGGTGFYFEALLTGLAQIPVSPADIVKLFEDRMLKEGPDQLYLELQKLDPVYAAKIHPHDRQRIQRSLEVLAATGKTLSWWHSESKPVPLAKGPLFVINTPLGQLEAGFARRIKTMLKNGAESEAARAWANAPDSAAPGWSGIGCRELLTYIRGKMTLNEAEKLWLANTRAYAKRQITWFKARKNAIWVAPEKDVILEYLAQ